MSFRIKRFLFLLKILNISSQLSLIFIGTAKEECGLRMIINWTTAVLELYIKQHFLVQFDDDLILIFFYTQNLNANITFRFFIFQKYSLTLDFILSDCSTKCFKGYFLKFFMLGFNFFVGESSI
jgi:hypothetical protein